MSDTVTAIITYEWYTRHKGEPFPEFYGKISKEEYIVDFEKPIDAMPQMDCRVYFFLLIPIIGFFIIFFMTCSYINKTRAYMQVIIDQFNAKYETQRGIRIINNYQGNFVKIEVKQPGYPIPGIELYQPSPDSLEAIQRFQSQTPSGKVLQTPGDVAVNVGY